MNLASWSNEVLCEHLLLSCFFSKLKIFQFLFWLDNALTWNGLMWMRCLVSSAASKYTMLENWVLFTYYLFLLSRMGWHHWEKKFPIVKDFGMKWAKSIQEFLRCLLHVTCEKLGLLIEEGAPKIASPHMAIAHESRGSSVVKVSLVWEEHWVEFWKPVVGGASVNMMQIVGEGHQWRNCCLSCQRMWLGLGMSPGTRSEESVKQKCVLSLKQWRFVYIVTRFARQRDDNNVGSSELTREFIWTIVEITHNSYNTQFRVW
jgi:hypothetical protein